MNVLHLFYRKAVLASPQMPRHHRRGQDRPAASRRRFGLVLPVVVIATIGLAFSAGAAAPMNEGNGLPRPGDSAHRHGSPSQEKPKELAPAKVNVPDVLLLDQEGREVRFYSDLVKGKSVVIHTIFTTCTTICPPMGANFAKLQKRLGGRLGRDVHLISVSVDPTVDTPQRLKAWGNQFGAAPGWTLVTGPKSSIDRLLKALKVFTAIPEDHSPILLVGNDASDQWTRIYGLAPPTEVMAVVERLMASSRAPRSADQNAAARYFTDVVLTNQDGEERRLYSDLLKGRTVVINTFFTTCGGACPVIMSRMKSIQTWLGERLGREAFLLSVSVDPATDTPQRLRAYAKGLKARQGWEFLTGEPDRVSLALRKLGQFVEDPENHTNLLIIGNEPTGLWKKALAFAGTDELIAVVESVLRDRGGPSL